MQRAVLTPRALVWPLRRCAVGSQHRRGPLAPRAGAMDSDLAAVRREAAARHAAAAAAQAAAPGPPSPAAAGAGAGSGGGSAEAASLALAQRLQAEEDAAARRLDDDDEVQIIDPPPKRQRQGPPSRAPVVADGIGFALTHCNSASSAHNVGAVSLADIFPVRGCRACGRPGSAGAPAPRRPGANARASFAVGWPHAALRDSLELHDTVPVADPGVPRAADRAKGAASVRWLRRSRAPLMRRR